MTQIESTTLVTFNPPSVRGDQPLSHALELFSQWQLTELPVVGRGQQVLGVLQLAQVVARAAADRRVLKCASDQHISAVPDPFQIQRFPRIALQQMLADCYRSLPVTEDGKLIGLISRGDFLRELAAGSSRLSTAAVLDHAVAAGAGVEPSASLTETFAALDADQSDFVAVIQSGFPIAACTRDGLETALNFAGAEQILYQQQPRPQTLVHYIARVPHLQPGQSVAEAAQLLVEHAATALLIVNKANRILGAITERIILTALLRGAV